MSKTTISSLTVGELFEATISDIVNIRDNIDFQGDVDVGVTLNTTLKDKTGLLFIPFKGNDSNQSTIQVKLATRIHISDQSEKYIFVKELRLDSEGKEVKALQRKLNSLLTSKLIIDGEFGTKTEDALKVFQYQQKISIKSKSFGVLNRETGKLLEQS